MLFKFTGSVISNVDDFMISSDTLMFPEGSGPMFGLSFEVPVVNDNIVENTENIQLQASILGAVIGGFSPGGDTADINILDDDSKMSSTYSTYTWPMNSICSHYMYPTVSTVPHD